MPPSSLSLSLCACVWCVFTLLQFNMAVSSGAERKKKKSKATATVAQPISAITKAELPWSSLSLSLACSLSLCLPHSLTLLRSRCRSIALSLGLSLFSTSHTLSRALPCYVILRPLTPNCSRHFACLYKTILIIHLSSLSVQRGSHFGAVDLSSPCTAELPWNL